MKKILLLLSLFTAFAAYAENAYTHKITFTFTFEGSPESQAQWNEITKMITEPFKRSGQNEEGVKALLGKLEQAFEDFPAFCNKRNIPGTCYVGVNSSNTTPNDTQITNS